MSIEFYTYDLTVSGSPEDLKKVNDLLLASGLVGNMPYALVQRRSGRDGEYTADSDLYGPILSQTAEQADEVLHSVAVQVPTATLEVTAASLDKAYGFTKRFHGDMYQESKMQSYLPPLQDGADIPFADRHNLPTVPKEPRQMFMLCEEYERGDALRQFEILATSADKDLLCKLLQAKVKMDEFGFIAQNGAEDEFEEGDTSFSSIPSEYDQSYVSYYIVGKPELAKDDLQALMDSPEYNTAFQYPSNFREVLADLVEAYADNEELFVEDPGTVADRIMENKYFQALAKQECWGSGQLNDYRQSVLKRDLNDFLDDIFDSDRKLFDSLLGVDTSNIYPDNLQAILVGSIYDVSRDLHLPVADAEKAAAEYMMHPNFESSIKSNTRGYNHLEKGSAKYEAVDDACYAFVKGQALAKGETAPPLGKLVEGAKDRAAQQMESATVNELRPQIPNNRQGGR